MKKLNVFLPVILLLWVAGANAHGPVRQKLTESIKVDAAPEVVWERLKEFGAVEWLPMVATSNAKGGNEKGATRVLTFKSGGSITEELKKYNVKKMSYAYKITDMSIVDTIQHSGEDASIKVLPVTDFAASIKVTASGKGAEVTWKAGYYRGYMNNNPPSALNEATAHDAVQAVFRAGLAGLKAISESKQPVKSTAKEAVAPKKSESKKSRSSANDKSKTAFDSNYPAASYEPKVIYIDKELAEASGASVKKREVIFDPEYPAAYFQPKIIYP
ncbi:MAG: SRPBCC family protein [Methyloprofundus sp.]|nr:SRPBCC family protein [Methyloprofundus sp.]